MTSITSILFLYIIVVLSSIIHEYAHGWAALRQGDSTAKYAGRLTLNPLPHLDLWGTVLMPLFILFITQGQGFFGYAKPVPINPYNFKNQRSGMIWVSVAGVGANFLIAVILGLAVRFSSSSLTMSLLGEIAFINIWLGLFNLLPFPPLDGSKLLLAAIGYRGSGRFASFMALASSPFGIIVAVLIAMTFLPYVSYFLFKLIVGG